MEHVSQDTTEQTGENRVGACRSAETIVQVVKSVSESKKVITMEPHGFFFWFFLTNASPMRSTEGINLLHAAELCNTIESRCNLQGKSLRKCKPQPPLLVPHLRQQHPSFEETGGSDRCHLEPQDPPFAHQRTTVR